MPSAQNGVMLPAAPVSEITLAILILSVSQSARLTQSVPEIRLVSSSTAGTPVLESAALMPPALSTIICPCVNVILDTLEMPLCLVGGLQHPRPELNGLLIPATLLPAAPMLFAQPEAELPPASAFLSTLEIPMWPADLNVPPMQNVRPTRPART